MQLYVIDDQTVNAMIAHGLKARCVRLEELPPGDMLVFSSRERLTPPQVQAWCASLSDLRKLLEEKLGSGKAPILFLLDADDRVAALDERLMNGLGWFKRKETP